MAGISHADSIVADSMASSSSPSPPTTESMANRDACMLVEPLVQAKRVSRIYGRPKIDVDAGDVTRDDPGSRTRILKTAPPIADEQVIPESDDVHDRVPSFDGFDWRAKLKEIDEDYNNSGKTDTTGGLKNASAAERSDASKVTQNAEASLHRFTTSPLSGLSHLSLAGWDQNAADITPSLETAGDSLFSGSQCSLLLSDQSSGSSLFSGSRGLLSTDEHEESGSMRKRSPPFHRRILMTPKASDSENTSPKHPYAINSPENRSSPTPPTSPFAGEPVANEATMSGEESVNEKSKLEQASRLSKKGKTKGEGRGGGKRIKHPTKKDVLEIQKESARLLADQQVSIRRAETQPVHTIANLFNKLKNAPIILMKQESDPIISFSSPGRPFMIPDDTTSSGDASPIQFEHLAPTGSCARPKAITSRSSRTYSSSETAEKSIHDNTEEDMPDSDKLLRDHNKGRRRQAYEQLELAETERRAKELEDHKRKALELSRSQFYSKATSSRAGAMARAVSDSDDDLEIVEDMINVPPRDPVVKEVKPLVDRTHAASYSIRAGRKSTSKNKTVSQTSLEFAARPTFVTALDQRNSRRKAGQGTCVSHKDLNSLMLQRADKQSHAIEDEKKNKWVRAGGFLKRQQHIANAQEKSVTDWLYVGSTREDPMEMNEECDGEDVQDPEYMPENVGDHQINQSVSESSEPPDAETPAGQQMDVSEDEPNADTDKENHHPALRKRSTRVIIDSDEEDDLANRAAPEVSKTVVLAFDTSFAEDGMDSPGEDKENSAELAFDLGEDKENARVPRHLPRGRVLNSNDTSPSPGFQDSDDIRVDREPLSSLEVEGGSLFVPPLVQRRYSGQGRVLQVLHEEDIYSTLSQEAAAKERLHRRGTSSLSSPGSIDEQVESPKPFLSGRFSQLFAGNDDVASDDVSGPHPAIKEASFSQFFSPTHESSLNRKDSNSFVHRSVRLATDDFQFTQQSGLLPSVRISESQRREVDEMFGKDQEFKLDEAKRSREEVKSSSETSVTGFLDLAPSQLIQLSPRSTRSPLGSLTLDSSNANTHLFASPENQSSMRGRLLRERPRALQESPSSSPDRRDAFDELRDAAAKRKNNERTPKIRFEESDFVEAEAQESDEEALLGFGGTKEDDDEGDDDPNAIVEGLVDDAVMDAKVQAADLVLEKHMEHQAADDAVLEKLHQDVVAGKLRGKRRDRGLGFEDSDSDDEYKGLRKPLNKKRRIEGDKLESVGQNPETKAFYDAYQSELVDNPDPRFAHLQQNDTDLTQHDEDSESNEELETIDSAEVRRRLRQLPKRENQISPEAEREFQDLSWIDKEDDGMADDFRVEERPFRLKKLASQSYPTFDQLDHRGVLKGKKKETAEQVQLKSWASQEARMHSSANGRGGFSRKEDSTSCGSRKQRRLVAADKMPVAEEDTRPTVKSSSLMSQMEKRKGFDS